MPRSFAKILLASDGEQVLFVVDIEPFSGQYRIQGVTRMAGDLRVTHGVIFEDPEVAYQALDAFDLSQADMMRTVALSHQVVQ